MGSPAEQVQVYDESDLYRHSYQASGLASRMVQTFDASDHLLSHIEQNNTSGGWTNSFQRLYSYDNYGHLDTVSNWGWDTIAGWRPGDKEAYSYSTAGRLLSYYYISTYQGVSQPMSGDVYTYDTADSLTSETHYQWDGASQLLPQARRHYRYCTAGDRVYEDRETWSAGAWLPVEADSMTYTAAHQLLSLYTASYVSGAWHYDGWIYNHYGASGRLDSVDMLTLTGSGWLLTSRSYYEYNAAGKLVVLSSQVDSNGGSRTLFSYDAAGHNIGDTVQQWIVDDWYNFSCLSYVYDSSGNQTMYQYARWNGQYWGLPGDYLYYYNYNTYNQWVVVDFYTFDLGSWQYFKQERYYYEEYQGPAGISEASVLTAMVAPDPFTDDFVVSFDAAASGFATLRLYDMVGKLITRTETTVSAGTNHIPCSGRELSPGVYVYELSTCGAAARGRVVRQ